MQPSKGLHNQVVKKRCTLVGRPLLNVETGVNGDSKSTNERGPSLVGSLGLSCRFNRFVFSLASVRPVQNIFFLTSIFPHRPTIWAGSQAGSPVFWYVSLNLMLRKYFSKGRWVQHAWASFTVSILSDAESLGLKKTMEKRETPHISFRVFLTHAISSVFFHYCQEIDFC
jgi:hypothetical protein